jgi:uncharacterized protein (TIGR02594 family)
MTATPWVSVAESLIGTKEIAGAKHEPLIIEMWKAIKRGGIKTDEVPWCAAFVGYCLEKSGIVSTRFESAKSYLTWGQELSAPVYGCIVIFDRAGGGHVGFVVGQDTHGRLLVIGGNQGNMVSIVPFDRARVAGYRMPAGVPVSLAPLQIIASNATSSENEA